MAGANVTLTNEARNFTRTQITNESGNYVFTAIPPGTYRVEVEATGFKKSSVNEVQALIDTPTNLEVQLEAGSISETVSVIAGGDAPINTSDATLGNTFESRRIIELPLNANNVIGLLSLQPGVTRTGYVNGGRSDQANITLDGVDVNEQQNGLDVVTNQAFSSVLRVIRDSVQEFRVVTTNPNADTGRSSGAQVSLATRAGSNDWHGSLFYYHRNTVTTANDFFNNKAGRFVATDPQVLSGTATVGDPRSRVRNYSEISLVDQSVVRSRAIVHSSFSRMKVFAKRPLQVDCRLFRCNTLGRESSAIEPQVVRAIRRVPRAHPRVSVA